MEKKTKTQIFQSSKESSDEKGKGVHKVESSNESFGENRRDENQLDKKIEALNNEIKQLKEDLLREKAETENIRRRMQKEIQSANKFAITNFAKHLSEQLEDLFRAIKNTEEAKDGKGIDVLLEGVKMTKRNMLKNFEKFKIHRLYPINEQFDHRFHQAVSQVVNNDKDDNTIIEVIKAGYVIGDRILDPAVVIVSKKSNDNT